MSRIAPAAGVTPKMYRHFAIITIVCTACLAIFASGEKTEALAAHAEQRDERQQPSPKAEKRKGNLVDGRSPAGRWGQAAGTSAAMDYVEPQDRAPWAAARSGTPARQLVYSPGVTPMDLERQDPLGEELKRELERKKGEQPQDGDVSQLISESRRRAGANDDSDTSL